MTRQANNKNLYIDSLDGIRAVAAMLVFLAHAGLEKLVPGGFGVTIFFFLSGYLITTLLRIEHEKTGVISLKSFYLRRVYRIFPPMYVVLLLDILLATTGQAPSDMTLGAASAQFTHLTNYYLIFFGADHIVPGSDSIWSLAVEEHFYFLYPLVLIFLLTRYKRNRIGLILLGCCGVVLLWRYLLVYVLNVSEDYTYMATDTRLDSLLFGCIMGIAINPALGDYSEVINQKKSLIALVLSIGAILVSFLYRDPQFRESLRYTIQGIALFPVFYCAVRYSRWFIFRWLNFRPIRALGIVSYTFYLIHLTVLGQLNRLFKSETLMRGFVGLLLSMLFSIAMYYLLEKPLGAMRRRLHPENSTTARDTTSPSDLRLCSRPDSKV